MSLDQSNLNHETIKIFQIFTPTILNFIIIIIHHSIMPYYERSHVPRRRQSEQFWQKYSKYLIGLFFLQWVETISEKSLLCGSCVYSRVRNKHIPMLIDFFIFFPRATLLLKIKRFVSYYISLHILVGLRFFFISIFPGATSIQGSTSIPDSRVTVY